uniref:Ubiquitin-like protease family profile domain-containing protein n=1 Tax=Lactuca sativa TaxID=4236 RepID=A0A9R1UJC1_LACSA|nr:hypothetical protein LSAT_V11C900464840 [Lactuca sativa]
MFMLPVVRACGFVLRKNRDMSRMKRWSGTKKLKMVDVNKIFSKIKGQPPRQNMLPSDEYVHGERKSVPSPVRDHFRRQDESSSSMPSSGRSHGRGRGSGKHNLEEVLKRLHALEQHVFTNREPRENNISFEELVVFQTKFDERASYTLQYFIYFINMYEYLCSYFIFENVDEVMNKNNTTENIFGDIEDDKELEERNDNAENKFDDANDYNEAKEVSEENEVIITGNVDYYDAYVAHDTEAKKKSAKKKVDIKSTSPVPPPVFVVVHDFSVLRLQPYVAGGEVVIHNYLFHSYDVQHPLFTFVLDRGFWSVLFGHTHDGWLESSYYNFVQHITIWYRLLMERRFDGDRHTIMPPNFLFAMLWKKGRIGGRLWLVLLRTPTLWLLVLLSIHSSPNHWLFGDLRLASMEVHIYDSLGRMAYGKFKFDGTFTKFESRVENYLDKINYWARSYIPRILLNMQFIYEKNVPQQNSHLGDYGVFVCMFMEQLVSGQPIRKLIDPRNAALEFRQRMTKFFWGSSLGPM